MGDSEALDAALLAAHACADLPALVRLYSDAATACEDKGEVDAACFFLTQGYVFALEAGDRAAISLHRRLKVHGRET